MVGMFEGLQCEFANYLAPTFFLRKAKFKLDSQPAPMK